MWNIPEIWKGERCWILGGGVSLPKQFGVPDSIINQVCNKILSPYVYTSWMKCLKDEHVIGTNMAYLFGSLVDVLFFGDSPFFRTHHDKIYSFSNTKVTCAELRKSFLLHQKDIHIIKRDLRSGIDISKTNQIRWNLHTGGAAINLAVLMGAKEIYLLGFDMKADEKGRTHWHKAYSGMTSDQVFNKFQESFSIIQRDAEKLGIKIVNVNPDSAITEFPKMKLGDVLKMEKPAPRRISFGLNGSGKDKVSKYETLSLLHEILNPRLYLEIGVRNGDSLRLAQCPSIGIDVNPCLKAIPNSEFCLMSSNEFFGKGMLQGRIPDLVFIDGLHNFEQVIQDFINVEKNSSRDTIVLFDDVLPFEEKQTTRDKPSNSEPWAGDVWKVVPVLKKYRPDLEIKLIDNASTGFMIVSNLNPKSEILSNKYNEIVSDWIDVEVSEGILSKEDIDIEKDVEWVIRNVRKVRDKKILCQVVHYYNPGQKEGFKGGSTTNNPNRSSYVHCVIDSMRQIPNCDVFVFGIKGSTCEGIDVDVDLTGTAPHWLLYETLNWRRSKINDYDYFITVEDDILIGQDTLWNIVEFDRQREINDLLLPNRFERRDGKFSFVDIKRSSSKWNESYGKKEFNNIPLKINRNHNSSVTIISQEKLKWSLKMLNPEFREIWFGGPMASAHAYFHSSFNLWRNSNLSRFHVVEHLDLFNKANGRINHHFKQQIINGNIALEGKIPGGLNEDLATALFKTYIPFKDDGMLGQAYNDILDSLAEGWVLFVDHDIFLRSNPHWQFICVKAIKEATKNVGMFVCMTNRLGNKIQVSPTAPKGDNIEEHIQHAKKLFLKNEYTTQSISKGSGTFMLIKKEAWRQAGGFPGEGMFGEDYEFSRRLLQNGFQIHLLKGLYVYHHRDRKDTSWISGEKLTKEFARKNAR